MFEYIYKGGGGGELMLRMVAVPLVTSGETCTVPNVTSGCYRKGKILLVSSGYCGNGTIPKILWLLQKGQKFLRSLVDTVEMAPSLKYCDYCKKGKIPLVNSDYCGKGTTPLVTISYCTQGSTHIAAGRYLS